MDTCPECGNHDLRVLEADGSSVFECGLCGERFGQRRAVQSLADREEADQHGYEVEVWPLVRALQKLAGVTVQRANSGSMEPERGPEAALAMTARSGLGQVENLAKMLRLAEQVLRVRWVVEVEAERNLLFVLRPRNEGEVWAPWLCEARKDLEALAAEIERNRRLQWWQVVEGAS